MVLSRDNGGITAFAQRGTGKSICGSTGAGLWSAEMANGRMDAAQFSATNATRKFAFEQKGEDAVDLIYACRELQVTVHVREAPGGFELSATIRAAEEVLTGFDLPARLAFDPAGVERLIAPADPDQSVGIAFNRNFFARQPSDQPTRWQGAGAGPGAFVALYGKGIPTLGDDAPAVQLSVTEQGTQWLPAAVAKMVSAAALPVLRPQPAELCDITLITSSHGAYFSGSQLGGQGGYLWRIGDGVRGEEQQRIAEKSVLAAVEKLMAAAPEGRTQVALLDLRNGPEKGSWSEIPAERWRSQLRRTLSAAGGRCTFVALKSISELDRALAAPDYLGIINPYGEGFPAADQAALRAAMAALKKYVHAGGNWFETGGYPFYQMLQPVPYLTHAAAYPPAYADLFHLQTAAGTAAVYRVQARPSGDPWQAAGQPEKMFIPGKLYCGGDEAGGYLGRSFTTWIKGGASWTTPKVHLTAGVTLEKTIADYCIRNSITTPLEKKISAATLAKFKQAPLLYLAGPCREKAAALDALPVPSLIHFADYLHGGFDKQYPDHLPPNKEFGTQQELVDFVAALHARGHLFSPYTNPTWWCDDPKSATFEREGTAALLVKADGKNRFEDYHGKTGWTTTLWHPAVQSANRRVVREFIEEVPVDMLFQDQCGARGFLYDFNPAAPTPYAYSEGMIAMNAEDSRRVPLGTEHGWDRVAEFQTMLCGMSWGIVPTQGGPAWRRCLKKTLPAGSWTIYPLAQAIAHDKCIFGHHDLGQFVTDNRSLVWTLALGYHMSYRDNAAGMKNPRSREWYAWICRIQKSIGARYTGQPLVEFEHDRRPLLEREVDHSSYNDDGIITAVYGDVKISANLGPVPRVVNGQSLAPYGFYAAAPGMSAGIVSSAQAAGGTAFVAEHTAAGSELWLWAAPGERVSVPTPLTGRIKVTLDGVPAVDCRVAASTFQLTLPLPEKAALRIEPPEDEQRRAPCNRPGERPLIGVVNLGPGAHTTWTQVQPEEWVAALNHSSLVTLHGLTVANITSWQQLQQALQEGPVRWLTIINPYGESILSEKKGGWQSTLEAIRSYVQHGGSWWESGGHSFHQELYREGEQWRNAVIGAAGLNHLKIQLAAGALDDDPQPLTVPRSGERWLGEPTARRVSRQFGQINRALVLSGTMPVTVLVQGEEAIYVGGYRFDGWGHLWRVGGMHPERGFVTAVVLAATLHQYTNPPEPVGVSGTPRLWHAVVER